MQAGFLWAAAALALVTFAVHTFVGGVVVARPLLADTGLPKASKWLNYYCWHVTTLTIVALGGAYVWSAQRGGVELAILATVLAASASTLSAAVAARAGINPLRFPSTSLFAATAACGAVGVLT